MKHARTLTVLLAIVAFCSLPVFGAGLQPLTVSPGATDRVTGVEVRCPTFSWQAVSGAVGYEVVVYELPPQTELAAWSLERAVEVLFVELPVGVTAWTPSLERGLARGADHVWFVRGVFGGGSEDATEWSAARFFRVAGEMTPAETRLVTREGIGRSGTGSGTGSGSMGASSRETKAEGDRNAMAKRVGETKTKDIGTAMAAIRGEMPDVAGETYGVVGTSNSPDGAGLGAVNTAGGPDLVLDGVEDGETDLDLYEWGIDRESTNAKTFSIANTGSGGMTLDVDGVEVVTTATDQDTLGGLICSSGELAKWNGSVWVCGSDLDTNTDTLAGLSCGSGQVAKWDDGYWACMPDDDTLAALGCALYEIPKWNGTSWQCFTDADTTYAFGPGLMIENGMIVIDPSAFSIRATVLDTLGYVGEHTSLAIGSDGLGLISYHMTGNPYKLKVAHCDDAACTGATITTLEDSSTSVGQYTSLAIGADGLGLISYHDNTVGALKVAHCDNLLCTSATISTLDSTGDTGEFTSIAIGADGLGLISYHDATLNDLKVAHCNDVVCSSAGISTLDSFSIVGEYTSIAIAADGLGIIAYYSPIGEALKIAHCDDVECTSATMSTLWSGAPLEDFLSLAIGADGLGLISFFSANSADLVVIHCDDVACTSGGYATTLDSTGITGGFSSIAFGPDGLGLITYYSHAEGALMAAHCINQTCSDATIKTVFRDGTALTGYYTSVAFGPDGRALVSFEVYSPLRDFAVAHLPIGF